MIKISLIMKHICCDYVNNVIMQLLITSDYSSCKDPFRLLCKSCLERDYWSNNMRTYVLGVCELVLGL